MAITYAGDIRPLFRNKDILQMQVNGGFDLGDYADVVAWADRILLRLEAGSMPCDGPWPQASIDAFTQWIADGKLP